jgi:deazaflavin-dependent oxidoreductase (nitroreductase family)
MSVHVLWKLDPSLLRLTRGRVSTSYPLRTALLETRGARSGKPRRTATLYFHDGERVTLVAALRGWPRHPAWYHNIRADPNVVYAGRPFRAEIISDAAEWQRLWELAERIYPQYAEFRASAAAAGRTIPIVQLVPRAT